MPPNSPLGILAGGGALPRRIIEACRKQDRSYFVVLFENQANPADYVDDPHAVVRLGAAGKSIDVLKKNDCEDLVMAGTIRRPSLGELRPDLWGMKFFATSGAAALGDDGLLSALIGALEGEGFSVVGADTLVPDLLVPRGRIGGRSPTTDEMRDIGIAWRASKDLGARDIGQAAVAGDGVILSEEDQSGTDAMLRKLADVNNMGGVLAKTLKPRQERRVDLPTIGVRTLENAHAAGLSGIVLEAGNAFVIDRDAVAEKADELGMFVIGADAEGSWD